MKLKTYKLKQKITFFIFILSFILLNINLTFATNLNNNNTKNYFRIHVVANSDDIDDQMLKLKVSKSIDEYIKIITKNSNAKEDYKKEIEENIQNILEIANTVIKENGKDYVVKAYIGNIKYDEKTKDNFSMKSGVYDSLKIIIGNGNGENWWSLIFPYSIDNINLNDENIETESIIFNLIKLVKEKTQGI